jgi:hypothetical protein
VSSSEYERITSNSGNQDIRVVKLHLLDSDSVEKERKQKRKIQESVRIGCRKKRERNKQIVFMRKDARMATT